MKFVIRDDDLNYFSTPADVERWYSDLFARGIPVGFAAVPFVGPHSDVYPFYPRSAVARDDAEEYPIHENEALIAYVKGNAYAEILQHGCTHATTNGIFEYAQHADLTEDTRRGKAELEKAFDREVTVFVPPHDWIGVRGIHAIEATGMDVIRGRGAGLRNWILRPRYVAIFVRMLMFKMLHVGRVPAYPHVLDFGLHKEACSYRLEDADLFEGLRYVHTQNGIFVVVAHLHSYTEEKHRRLRELIALAQELGAEFAYPHQIFR